MNRKQCNDYEALETTTATGSVTNLSSITSLSEALQKQNSVFIKQNGNSPMISNNNNNELISRSSKITEELEIKLKERRMLTECSSEEIDTKSINNEKRNLSDDNKNEENESPNKCACPCHCHHNNNRKNNSSCKPVRAKNNHNINNLNHNNYNKHHTSSYHHRQIIVTEDNIQTTDENSPTFTPLKRESIRKLMENKAVTANKQKNELERHLSSMLISRINSSDVTD